MQNTTRYDRQERIDNWQQENITNTRINLIGSGRLSDYLLVDLLSMGFGDILRVGYSDFFEFEKINPEVNLEQNGEFLSSKAEAERMLYSGIIIDATNDLPSKYLSSRIANEKKLPFYSVSSSMRGFSISGPSSEGATEFHTEYNREQGNISSLIASAIITDEIRKKVMPLKGDSLLGNYKYDQVKETDCLEKKLKILQVGAGAIGTFSALGLSAINANICLLDFDTVDESNLNRQFLFYDAIGKNKAEALASKLSKYTSGKIMSLDKKIGEDFHPRNFDAVFSCVDNITARYHMNRACKRYIMPLVNAGSSSDSCDAMPSYPHKTACLDCQMGFKLTTKYNELKTKRNSNECFHPSIIISNQIAGALMTNSFLKANSGIFEKSSYMSGFGIFDEQVNSQCLNGCKS
jgi:molybdopterin/thiamine biosynthesis adenylyltransferase